MIHMAQGGLLHQPAWALLMRRHLIPKREKQEPTGGRIIKFKKESKSGKCEMVVKGEEAAL